MLQKSHPPKMLLASLLQSLNASDKKALHIANSGDLYIARAATKIGCDVHCSDPTIFGRCIAALVSKEKIELRCNDGELNSIFARALQLSHNAVVGQDDPLILHDIYSEIDNLMSKEYTGIIDEMLQSIKPVELADLPQPEIPLYELRFVFCQADREYVQQVLDQLEQQGVNKEEDAIVIGDPDRFIHALTLVKKHVNIQDRSIALLRMCQISEEYMRQKSQPPTQ